MSNDWYSVRGCAYCPSPLVSLESVTADDIVRVTTAMRERSLLSLAAMGDLSCVPEARQAEKVIMAEQSMWSRLYR